MNSYGHKEPQQALSELMRPQESFPITKSLDTYTKPLPEGTRAFILHKVRHCQTPQRWPAPL